MVLERSGVVVRLWNGGEVKLHASRCVYLYTHRRRLIQDTDIDIDANTDTEINTGTNTDLNEVRVVLDVCEQSVLIFGHAEKV